MESTPELDAFEAEYFDNDGTLTFMEFVVESHSQPLFRAALAEQAIEAGEDPKKGLLNGVHKAMHIMVWHFDAHEGSDRLAVIGTAPDGGVYQIERTRREWNDLIREGLGHHEVEEMISGLLGV